MILYTYLRNETYTFNGWFYKKPVHLWVEMAEANYKEVK